MKIGTILLVVGIVLVVMYLCLMSNTIAYQFENPGPTPAYGVKTGTGLDRIYLDGDGDEGVTLTGLFFVLAVLVVFGVLGLAATRIFSGGCGLLVILTLFFGLIGLVYMATTR
jgi:hypothetical protein